MAVGRKVEVTLACRARAPVMRVVANFCTFPAKLLMARCWDKMLV